MGISSARLISSTPENLRNKFDYEIRSVGKNKAILLEPYSVVDCQERDAYFTGEKLFIFHQNQNPQLHVISESSITLRGNTSPLRDGNGNASKGKISPRSVVPNIPVIGWLFAAISSYFDTGQMFHIR